LHYTIIAHSMWIEHCLREQYVYTVPYEPGVMFVADGRFVLSECLSPAWRL